MTATAMDPTILAEHRLPNAELDNWSRNMSDDRTIYAESTNDGASTYTASTAKTNRSVKDRFKLVFGRKKRTERAKSETSVPASVKRSLSISTLRKKSLPEKVVEQDHPESPTSVSSKPHRLTLNKDTGEIQDYTTMMHSLVHRESFDSTPEHIERYDEHREPGEPMIASLPPKLWRHIAQYLSLSGEANLSLSSKTLLDRVGTDSWKALANPYNRAQKIAFLMAMDRALPNHLYCVMCEKYHVRIQNGKENLKPTTTINHLFHCPMVEHTPPRVRIASGRTLPFTFVQLALRADRWGPEYGVTLNSMARRWKEPETGWSHTTVYRIHNGHLIMRVISQKFAEGGMVEAAKRGFFYNMYEDFTPYFSVCAHWRDGDLMKICKCAVDHLPPPKYRHRDAHKMVQTAVPQKPRICAMCGVCQPMRRCPECPTEYLVELKLVEDLKDPIFRFKQSIVITRWSDLGDGTTPENIEWAAINGQAPYSSVIEIGRRAISGIFESKTSNDNMNIPGQRIVSLNPKEKHEGEEGDDWF